MSPYFWAGNPTQLLGLINRVCSPAGAFDDDDVTHVEGEVNPVRDLDIINEELRLKDESYLLPYIDKFEKTTLRSDKKAKPEYVSADAC